MSDSGAQTSGPQTRREAALRVVLGEMNDLFARVDSLLGHMQTVDKSTKETARTVQEALRAAKQVAAAMPDKPLPMLEPDKPARPLVMLVAVSVVSGVIAGIVVAGGMMLSIRDRGDARIGRAVMAVYPSLDAGTREKLQAAMNKAPQ